MGVLLLPIDFMGVPVCPVASMGVPMVVLLFPIESMGVPKATMGVRGPYGGPFAPYRLYGGP